MLRSSRALLRAGAVAPCTPFAPSLVILDKDGTLLDNLASFVGWTKLLTTRLAQATRDPSVRVRINEKFGVTKSGIVDGTAPLANATLGELRSVVRGVVPDRDLVDGVWRDCESQHALVDPRPLGDLHRLLTSFRQRGTQVALLTADSRANTERELAALRIYGLVGYISCGDDGLHTKPDPLAALDICDALRVPPARTALVGDTPVDMLCARDAGLGRAVGVLSGAGTAMELLPIADCVVPDITAACKWLSGRLR